MNESFQDITCTTCGASQWRHLRSVDEPDVTDQNQGKECYRRDDLQCKSCACILMIEKWRCHGEVEERSALVVDPDDLEEIFDHCMLNNVHYVDTTNLYKGYASEKRGEVYRAPEKGEWSDGSYWNQKYRSIICDSPTLKHWQMRRADLVISGMKVMQLQPTKIYVPGCGISTTAKILKYMGYDVYANDLSAAAIEQQLKTGESEKFLQRHFRVMEPATDMPGCMQYVRSPSKRLRYLQSIGKPGGRIRLETESWSRPQESGFDLVVFEHCFKGYNIRKSKKAISAVARFCDHGATMLFIEINDSQQIAMRACHKLGMKVTAMGYLGRELEQERRWRGPKVSSAFYYCTG